MNFTKKDFHLGPGTYLLSHSVGRPLKRVEEKFQEAFLKPWLEGCSEPWTTWMKSFQEYGEALAALFGEKDLSGFCPQVNNSSALVKIVGSLPRLRLPSTVVLMSEIDFPSMGYALRQALHEKAVIRFIPAAADITDSQVWDEYLKPDVDLVFISHAYSNTGQKAPVEAITALARKRSILSLIDVAQSAGVIPLDLSKVHPDFVIGSSVKWLCGGPGSAFLWVHPGILPECVPQDVGWFSHAEPFNFDIHAFKYHPTALKFWGGTPSVAPYAIAKTSIQYLSQCGVASIREHNQKLIQQAQSELAEFFVSPLEIEKRTGTFVLNFAQRQEQVEKALQENQILFDKRKTGLRFSPHVYNDAEDIQKLILSIRKSI